MNRLAIIFMAFFSGCLFAKDAATAHFCVQEFLKEADYRTLKIQPVGEVAGDKKWKWPDSLTCGNVYWKNEFALIYKGDSINFKEEYNAIPGKIACRSCTDKERLRDRAVPAPSMSELVAHKYYIEDELFEEKKPMMDEASVKELYGKKFNVEWKTSLLCTCPEYGVSNLKTKMNVVIDGECAKQAVDSAKVDSADGTSGGECGCSGKCSSGKEEKQDTVLAAGVFPCYSINSSRNSHSVSYYASTKVMNLDGQPEGTDESLGCFSIRGQNYLVLGSNVPKPIYHEFDEDSYNDCYESEDDFKKMKLRTSPFYTCGQAKSTPRGCLPLEEGTKLAFDSSGKFTGWDYYALWVHAGQETKEKGGISLPANVSGNVLTEIGNDAARKTAGMAFYCGRERIGYKKFERNQLSSLKEAIDACNAWQKSGACFFDKAKEDSIAAEKARQDKEWRENRDREVNAEKKAHYDQVEATRKRLEKDSAFINLNRAYEIFKRYEKVVWFDLEGKEIANPDSVDPFDLMTRKWMVRMEDSVKYARVMDSINTLSHPFFERIHQRSEPICKGGFTQNDTLKELGKVLAAWYQKNGRKDYFVENMSIAYRAKPCKINEKKSETFHEIVEEDCEYIKVDFLCVDEREMNSKRMFLTKKDWEELDVFSGCDRWTGRTKQDDDRYNKEEFLPFQTSLNAYDMCFDYGSESFYKIYLNLGNGEATVYGACIEFSFKKVDGVWKYTGAHVKCWI